MASGPSSSGPPIPASSATGPAALAGGYAEFVRQQLRDPDLSDFEREVLERAAAVGVMAQGDYEEAFRRYEACLTGRGYAISWVQEPSGIHRITGVEAGPAAAAADPGGAAVSTCAVGTLAVVEALFGLQQNNPDLAVDPRIGALRCLRDSGYISEAYTVEDFEADWASGFAGAPFDAMDPAANSCLFAAGYAVAISR